MCLEFLGSVVDGMKRVLVNDRCLYQPGAGIATYLGNLLRNWPADGGVEVRGFSTHERRKLTHWPEALPGAERQIILKPVTELQPPATLRSRIPVFARPMLTHLQTARFAGIAWKGKYDACFEPNSVAGRYFKPTVTTLHDLSVLEHPEWHPAQRVLHWERSLASSLKVTGHWMTDSYFSRDRMVKLLGIDEKKIDVVHLAARALPFPSDAELARFCESIGLTGEYLLHLGTVEPRKNIKLLLDAYALLPANLRQRCKLVLAGGAGWGKEDFWAGLRGHPVATEVVFTGFVTDAAAAALLKGATAVLVSSWYEGFGLPILEGMSAGRPVLASTIPVFDEVAGDAAPRLDPANPQAWADAMQRVIEDPAHQSDLAERGRAQNAKFSWTKAATHAAQVLRDFTARL
jgi:glycosyltransferase involved in cell wall biosynthesis